MSEMQDRVFGAAVSEDNAEALLHRVEHDDGMELWLPNTRGRLSARAASSR
jgi:hypothetical protein